MKILLTSSPDFSSKAIFESLFEIDAFRTITDEMVVIGPNFIEETAKHICRKWNIPLTNLSKASTIHKEKLDMAGDYADFLVAFYNGKTESIQYLMKYMIEHQKLIKVFYV